MAIASIVRGIRICVRIPCSIDEGSDRIDGTSAREKDTSPMTREKSEDNTSNSADIDSIRVDFIPFVFLLISLTCL
jgi:hypothetical protein